MNNTTISTKIFGLADLTEIQVQYTRPTRKGRSIFGGLVPFNKIWRTGADGNTTLSFSEDVSIDGKILPKGIYALYTVPTSDRWQVIFYKNINSWGVPRPWDPEQIALVTEVPSDKLDRPVESLTISVNNTVNNQAILEISWENTLVEVKFEIPSQRVDLPENMKIMSGASANDFYSSASFYNQYDRDVPGALWRIDYAIDMNDDKPFFYYRLKSLIHAKLGDYKEAITAAEDGLAASTAAGHDEHIKLNQDSIAEWQKLV